MKYRLQHCPSNPTLEYADSIIIPDKYDEIVSIGWGSTIDVGKWLAVKYKLKHTAIPTTAGSGSEVTKYCVLMVDGKKKTFKGEEYVPDEFQLDAALTLSLPKLHTISSGLDALSHAMEAYWSTNATKQSKSFALIAIKSLIEFFPQVIHNPKDIKARENMLFAANLAGRAINITETNVCHAISYPLTEIYGIPHGIACGITLPYFIKKFSGISIEGLMKKLRIKKYLVGKCIDKEMIADIVMQSPKLEQCPKVQRHDIINALNVW